MAWLLVFFLGGMLAGTVVAFTLVGRL